MHCYLSDQGTQEHWLSVWEHHNTHCNLCPCPPPKNAHFLFLSLFSNPVLFKFLAYFRKLVVSLWPHEIFINRLLTLLVPVGWSGALSASDGWPASPGQLHPVALAGTEPLVLGRSKAMKGVTAFLFPAEQSVVLALSKLRKCDFMLQLSPQFQMHWRYLWGVLKW